MAEGGISESSKYYDKLKNKPSKESLEHLSEDVKVKILKLMVDVEAHEAFGNPNYKWNLNNFELGQRLGRGKFGKVYLARVKTTTSWLVAIKTMLKKELVEAKCEQQTLREIEIQTRLKHPNILQLLAWFHDDFRIYLVLEYAANGELYTHLKNSPGGRFSEHQTAKYIYQVTDAVNYCHQNYVIHRDIKPENLLLTVKDNIKLADFGWSVHAPSLCRKTMCGTAEYLPPEIIKGKEYGQYVDHWCIGILCYEFLVGRSPFFCDTKQQMYDKICHADLEFPPQMPHGAADLIRKLLVRDGKVRLSLLDVMKHEWIVQNK